MRLCKAVWDFVRLCKSVQGCLRPCGDVWDHVRIFWAVLHFVRICETMWGCAKLCETVWRCVRIIRDEPFPLPSWQIHQPMQSQSNYDLPPAHVVADCGHSGRYAQWKGVATQHKNEQNGKYYILLKNSKVYFNKLDFFFFFYPSLICFVLLSCHNLRKALAV